MSIMSFFSAYFAHFEKRLPDLTRMQHRDELDDYSADPECFKLTPSPFTIHETGKPEGKDYEEKKHLWVIKDNEVPVMHEKGRVGKRLTRKKLSHTNLTGGKEAYAGGEFWCYNNIIYINGGSSRYQPRNLIELDEIKLSLERAGFTVCCAGWEGNIPSRSFREFLK
jgi:hypothetical protein